MFPWDDAVWDAIDLALARWKAGRLGGAAPSLGALIPPLGDPNRTVVLVALIKVDLEHRWNLGQRSLVEDYVAEFSELTDQPESLVELLEAECRVRSASGQVPCRDELRERFGDLADQLDLESLGEPRDQSAPGALLAGAADGDLALPPAAPAGAVQGPPVMPPGTRLGKYTIEGMLGRGGMSTVYRARDEVLGRVVAIKVHRTDRTDCRLTGEMLLAEARKVATLNAPGIVAALDFVQRDEQTCFFVMEHVEGESLEQRLAAGGVSHRQAAEIAAQVAQSLAVAHRAGFVHRDIKPANILIDQQDTARLTDFGLAIDDATQWRQAGETAGTLPYMSPEQIDGASHLLDGRTDLWALGVVLYRMLTGRLPFLAATYEALCEEITLRAPKPLRMIDPSIPRELERICLKCLCQNPADRYATAGDMADDLRRWLQPARPRRIGLAALVAVAAALVVGAGGRMVWKATSRPPIPDTRWLALEAAVSQGLVEAYMTSTGLHAGDAVRLRLRRKTARTLRVDITPGTVLRGQHPPAARVVCFGVLSKEEGERCEPVDFVLLEDDRTHAFRLEAYSYDFEPAAAPGDTEFTIDGVDATAGQIIATGKQFGAGADTIQLAVWLHNGASEARLRDAVGSSEIETAKALLDVVGGAQREEPHMARKSEKVLEGLIQGLQRRWSERRDNKDFLRGDTVEVSAEEAEVKSLRQTVATVRRGDRCKVLAVDSGSLRVEVQSATGELMGRGWISRDCVQLAPGFPRGDGRPLLRQFGELIGETGRVVIGESGQE